MTRLRRSLYSLAATYLNTGIVLVSGLVTTPLLLHYLGEDRVGVARIVVEYLGYTMLLSAGLDGALNVIFARAAADRDHATTAAAIHAGMRAYFGVALMAVTWVGVLIAFAPRMFGLNGPIAALTGELRIALGVAVVGQFSMVLGVFKPLAEAEQRGYVVHLANAFGTFVGLTMSLSLAWLGFGLPGQVTALLLSPAISSIALAIESRRRHRELRHLPAGPRLDGVRSINPAMLLYQFCGRVSFLSDCILISLVLGADSVAAFSTTQRLLLMLQGIVNALGSSTWAALANLHLTGQHDAFSRRLVQLTRLVMLTACAAFVPAAVWNGPFVRAWTDKPHLFSGDALSLLTALSLALMCVLSLWGWPLATTGRILKLLPIYIAGAVVNVSASVIATHLLGPLGPPIGTVINLLAIMLGWMAWRLHREFGTGIAALVAAAAVPLLLAIPYTAVLWFLSRQFSVDDLAASRVIRMGIVAALVGVCAVLYLAIALVTIVPAADRREFLTRFRKPKS